MVWVSSPILRIQPKVKYLFTKTRQTNFENNNSKEVVIMIGSPGSGKSSIAKNNLSNYKLICGDTFRNTKSMINEANKFKNESIIFDGTNGTKKKKINVYIICKNNKC